MGHNLEDIPVKYNRRTCWHLEPRPDCAHLKVIAWKNGEAVRVDECGLLQKAKYDIYSTPLCPLDIDKDQEWRTVSSLIKAHNIFKQKIKNLKPDPCSACGRRHRSNKQVEICKARQLRSPCPYCGIRHRTFETFKKCAAKNSHKKED